MECPDGIPELKLKASKSNTTSLQNASFANKPFRGTSERRTVLRDFVVFVWLGVGGVGSWELKVQDFVRDLDFAYMAFEVTGRRDESGGGGEEYLGWAYSHPPLFLDHTIGRSPDDHIPRLILEGQQPRTTKANLEGRRSAAIPGRTNLAARTPSARSAPPSPLLDDPTPAS